MVASEAERPDHDGRVNAPDGERGWATPCTLSASANVRFEAIAYRQDVPCELRCAYSGELNRSQFVHAGPRKGVAMATGKTTKRSGTSGRKTATKRATTRKTATKKGAAKKSPARKSAGKKSAGKKSAAKSPSAKSTAQKKVKKVMHERKAGTLRSGKSGKKVSSRKQAIAIGLSKARKKGKNVPRKKKL
jgi:hypothetical protein